METRQNMVCSQVLCLCSEGYWPYLNVTNDNRKNGPQVGFPCVGYFGPLFSFPHYYNKQIRLLLVSSAAGSTLWPAQRGDWLLYVGCIIILLATDRLYQKSSSTSLRLATCHCHLSPSIMGVVFDTAGKSIYLRDFQATVVPIFPLERSVLSRINRFDKSTSTLSHRELRLTQASHAYQALLGIPIKHFGVISIIHPSKQDGSDETFHLLFKEAGKSKSGPQSSTSPSPQ